MGNTAKSKWYILDKDVHRTDRSIDIFASEDMPNPDPLMHVGTNANLEILKELLVTYNMHNTELGYVQGMSDLLSPLFAVIEDVPLVFWAFVGFMERMVCRWFHLNKYIYSYLQVLLVSRSPTFIPINPACTSSYWRWITCCSLWIPVFISISSVPIVATSSFASAGY